MSAQAPPQQAPSSAQVTLGALAVVLAADVAPTTRAALALPLLAELGIAPAAALKALALLVPSAPSLAPLGKAGSPLAPGQPLGDALRHVSAAEPVLRATYLVNAARRAHAGQATPAQERAYLARHLAATHARARAAVEVDRAAREHGPLLGWHALLDSQTTPECRAAHGSNFAAGKPPVIGYPGTLHGGTCRCRAGAPFREALATDEAVATNLPRITGAHDVAFSRDEAGERVIDLVFDPAEPRDRHGRWQRVVGWLRPGNRSKLGGDGNPPEHPRAPRGSRARDEAARVVAFPQLSDAIEAQRLGAELVGQEPQPLELRAALESALARPRNHVAYGGDLADAAAALAHGVAQAQAFADGNKRVALALAFHFLLENGYRLQRAEIDELAAHIGGYGEGTHTFEQTANWLRSVLSRPHPGD